MIDRDLIREGATNQAACDSRRSLARFTSTTFGTTGELLHVGGHIVGPDRVSGNSPFGNGSDETVAVSLLLRIASQLVSAAADLFSDGRVYAAGALLRQLVEIEYLSWAFATKDKEGERWLRSSRAERQSFFTPAKLRNAAGGRFRAKDYGYHCELGGHPVPGATVLLRDDALVSELLLSDLLTHTGCIWGHVVAWARANSWGPQVVQSNEEMAMRYARWKEMDPLVALPPPP